MEDKSTTETALAKVLDAIDNQTRPLWERLTGPFLTVVALVTASVIYVGATSEEEAKKVTAPLEARIESVERQHAEGADGVKKAVADSQKMTEAKLDGISNDLDSIAEEQKAQGEKIHAIDKKQTALEATVRSLARNPPN